MNGIEIKMFENRIRLAKPWIPDEAFERLRVIFKSGWIAGGKTSKEFAQKVADVEEYKYGVATNSCTSALQIALALSKVEGSVRMPDISFPATANAIIASGYRPLITGQPYDLGVDLFGLKTGRRDWSVGDCACSLGSRGGIGKPVIACYSFHARKLISTGEGGVLCTDDREVAKAALELTGQGSHSGFEYSMRMSDINAVIGLVQLELFEEILEQRHKIVEWYNLHLPADIEVFGQVGHKTNKNFNYQTFVVVLPSNVSFTTVEKRLMKNGVECNFGTYRLNKMSYYEKYVDPATEFEEFNYLALPLYHEMTEKDVIYVCDALRRWV